MSKSTQEEFRKQIVEVILPDFLHKHSEAFYRKSSTPTVALRIKNETADQILSLVAETMLELIGDNERTRGHNYYVLDIRNKLRKKLRQAIKETFEREEG